MASIGAGRWSGGSWSVSQTAARAQLSLLKRKSMGRGASLCGAYMGLAALLPKGEVLYNINEVAMLASFWPRECVET